LTFLCGKELARAGICCRVDMNEGVDLWELARKVAKSNKDPDETKVKERLACQRKL
jgi:hypothetical protein